MVCKKFAIIMRQSFESLYAFAPMKPYPSAMAIGFLNPLAKPSSSCRSAMGYTPPPPTVLSFPVTLPTMTTRASGLSIIDGRSFEIIRKWDRKLICMVCSC